jgi:hypothetical protein
MAPLIINLSIRWRDIIRVTALPSENVKKKHGCATDVLENETSVTLLISRTLDPPSRILVSMPNDVPELTGLSLFIKLN